MKSSYGDSAAAGKAYDEFSLGALCCARVYARFVPHARDACAATHPPTPYSSLHCRAHVLALQIRTR